MKSAMDLNHHDHNSHSNPIMFIFFVASWFIGIIAVSIEDRLQQIDLVLSILSKLVSPVSFLFFIILYYDKIAENWGKIKSKFKKRKKHGNNTKS